MSSYRKEAKKKLIHNYNLRKKKKIMKIYYIRIAKAIADFYKRPTPNLIRFLEESQKNIQDRDHIYEWKINRKEI